MQMVTRRQLILLPVIIPDKNLDMHNKGSLFPCILSLLALLFADLPAQELNSTLRPGLYACPGDILDFVCKTRDSPILTWSSDEYIGVDGESIEFLNIEPSGTVKLGSNQRSVAMLNNASTESGISIMLSTLKIVVLPSLNQRSHSITCTNVGIGTKNITAFQLAGMFTNCEYVCITKIINATTFQLIAVIPVRMIRC